LQEVVDAIMVTGDVNNVELNIGNEIENLTYLTTNIYMYSRHN